jgi:hypothetical protein
MVEELTSADKATDTRFYYKTSRLLVEMATSGLPGLDVRLMGLQFQSFFGGLLGTQ